MSLKKLAVGAMVLIGGALCLWLGFVIAPDEPALRTLGLFLYFYVCAEIAFQISISRKKHKEDKLKAEETNKK